MDRDRILAEIKHRNEVRGEAHLPLIDEDQVFWEEMYLQWSNEEYVPRYHALYAKYKKEVELEEQIKRGDPTWRITGFATAMVWGGKAKKRADEELKRQGFFKTPLYKEIMKNLKRVRSRPAQTQTQPIGYGSSRKEP